jgi:hypothetical protein
MSIEKTDPVVPNGDAPVVHGSGSVAHQIIGEFLSVLEKNEDYRETSRNLRAVIFEGKPTETALRTAMFGEELL